MSTPNTWEELMRENRVQKDLIKKLRTEIKQLEKDQRNLKREYDRLEVLKEGAEIRHREAEGKIDFLNRFMKQHDIDAKKAHEKR